MHMDRWRFHSISIRSFHIILYIYVVQHWKSTTRYHIGSAKLLSKRYANFSVPFKMAKTPNNHGKSPFTRLFPEWTIPFLNISNLQIFWSNLNKTVQRRILNNWQHCSNGSTITTSSSNDKVINQPLNETKKQMNNNQQQPATTKIDTKHDVKSKTKTHWTKIKLLDKLSKHKLQRTKRTNILLSTYTCRCEFKMTNKNETRNTTKC